MKSVTTNHKSEVSPGLGWLFLQLSPGLSLRRRQLSPGLDWLFLQLSPGLSWCRWVGGKASLVLDWAGTGTSSVQDWVGGNASLVLDWWLPCDWLSLISLPLIGYHVHKDYMQKYVSYFRKYLKFNDPQWEQMDIYTHLLHLVVLVGKGWGMWNFATRRWQVGWGPF